MAVRMALCIMVLRTQEPHVGVLPAVARGRATTVESVSCWRHSFFDRTTTIIQVVMYHMSWQTIAAVLLLSLGSLKMVGVIMGWVNPKAPGFLLDPVMLAWVMGVLEVSLAVLIRFCLPRVAGAAVLGGLGFVFVFYRGVEAIFVQPGGGCPCLGGITSVAPWLRAFEQPLLTALALFLLLFGAWAYLWESSFIKKSSA